MEQRTLAERLAYLGLDDEAFALLRQLKPLLDEHADSIAEQYYRHLLAFEETRRLFRDEETKAHFLRSRSRFIRALADPVQPGYEEERSRSGRNQEAAGLSPAWITRLAALHVQLLAPLLAAHFRFDRALAARMIRVIAARFALDVEIAIEAYIEHHERGLAFLAEELAGERRRLQQNLREQDAELRETAARAKVAEELASIATLVAGLAHEIGTPMGVIQGHAKMLEPCVAGDEDGTWRLHTIQEQIARISRIINTLLKIGSPRRGVAERVDLAAVVEQSLAFVGEKLVRRGIEVSQGLAPGVFASGDPERLQQLVLNLLLNAADAMPEGGVLEVEVAVAEGLARVRVADTGVGISADDIVRVFEPFYTTKESGEGNGLGLMVCKGIAADHGGEITVKSELGKGTVFSVNLPAAGPVGGEAEPDRPITN